MKPQVIVLTIGTAILKKKSKSEKFTDGWTDQWAEDRHQMIKRAETLTFGYKNLTILLLLMSF